MITKIRDFLVTKGYILNSENDSRLVFEAPEKVSIQDVLSVVEDVIVATERKDWEVHNYADRDWNTWFIVNEDQEGLKVAYSSGTWVVKSTV